MAVPLGALVRLTLPPEIRRAVPALPLAPPDEASIPLVMLISPEGANTEASPAAPAEAEVTTAVALLFGAIVAPNAANVKALPPLAPPSPAADIPPLLVAKVPC